MVSRSIQSSPYNSDSAHGASNIIYGGISGGGGDGDDWLTGNGRCVSGIICTSNGTSLISG